MAKSRHFNSSNDDLSDFYREASELYCYVTSGHSTVKKALYGGNFSSDIRKIYAVVMETLKRQDPLKEVLKEAGLWNSTSACEESHSRGEGCVNCQHLVQAYDLLIGTRHARRENGKQGGQSACPLAANLNQLINAQATVVQRTGVKTVGKLYAVEKIVNLPKYARINTLLTTKEETLKYLQDVGLEEVVYDSGKTSYDEFLQLVCTLKEHQFTTDYHMDDLLVFSDRAMFQNDEFYLARKLLLQDKGSCIPAKVLLENCEEIDGDVLDACAAPGNKTSQLLAYLRGGKSHKKSRTLFAVDRDSTRFNTMTRMLKDSGATEGDEGGSGVKLMNFHGDFLKVDPTSSPEFSNVRFILLDPSCSGSGIVRHVDRYLQNKDSLDDARIRSLANLQATLLKHALSFPNVQRVVYSTCSLTEEENESVVRENLERVRDTFDLHPIWTQQWPTRGQGEDGMEACLRTDPSHSLTGGFFVACFQRRKEAGGVLSSAVKMPKQEPQVNTQSTSETVSAKKKKKKNARQIKKKMEYNKNKKKKKNKAGVANAVVKIEQAVAENGQQSTRDAKEEPMSGDASPDAAERKKKRKKAKHSKAETDVAEGNGDVKRKRQHSNEDEESAPKRMKAEKVGSVAAVSDVAASHAKKKKKKKVSL